MSIFKSFKSSKPTFNKLGEVKNHLVNVEEVVLIDSFTKFDGSQKEDLPPWEDPTPQLAIRFRSTTGKGSIVHRYNGCGYKKAETLTKEELDSGKYEVVEDCKYALVEEDGSTVREQDAENTASCANIMNQLFFALGIPEGSDIDALEKAKNDGYELRIDVVEKVYMDKPQLRVEFTRPAGEVEEVAEEVAETAEELDA